MPIKPCSVAGCRALVAVGLPRCDKHQSDYDRARGLLTDTVRAASPARKWYKTVGWQKRRKMQLAGEPLCRLCPEWSKQPATVADHIIPHRGNHGLFWFGALQSLCKSCHDTKKQRIERRGGGLKVWNLPPTDRRA